MSKKRRKNRQRHPSGKIAKTGAKGRANTALDAKEARSVAVEARMRVYGISEKRATVDLAGSFVGRLRQEGHISEGQFEAAEKFLECRNAYHKAILAPSDIQQRKPGSGMADISDEYADWCAARIAEWDRIREAVETAQCEPSNRSANLWAALDICVTRDEWHSHLVGDLRIALNVLSRLFRLDRNREAA